MTTSAQISVATTGGATVSTPYDTIPNFARFPTVITIGSGNWSDPNVWSAGRLPTANDVVSITSGTTITYDIVSDAALKSLVVQAGGRLHFRTDISTRVTVQNFLVLENGELRVGTAANPVAATVKAEIIFPNVALDTASDPNQFGNGLVALGKVTMHGSVKSDTYIRLAAEPRAGQTTITLAQAATGWQVGDRLALPDTRHLKEDEIWTRYVPQWELATIQSISADGKTLTLAAPLKFDHIGARNAAGALEFLPHVANLSRNVVVRSQSASGTRGHVMFTHRADVDVRYVQFAGLGRTTENPADTSDRYPVYFRNLIGPTGTPANGYQYTFVGNSVTCPLDPMPFRWGITIKNSHYGLISGNVLYNWAGAGLVTQDGNESFNVIEKNFVMGVRGHSNPRDNNGLDGSVFWFSGFNNYVRDNVASSGTTTIQQIVAGVGYKYYIPSGGLSARVPLFKGADVSASGQYQTVQMRQTPILEFARNEAYGAMATGLTIWHLGTDGYFAENIGQSVIKDFRVWHANDEGFFAYPIQNVLFDGFVVRGHTRAQNGVDGGLGWQSGDYWAGNVTIRNADIQGMYYGGIGNSLNTPGVFRIENSYFRNVMGNITITTLATPGSMADTPARRTEIVNARFDAWPGGPALRTINMNYDTHLDHTDVLEKDEVFVYNYNGVTGDNFQLYYTQQHPDFIVPVPTGTSTGAPEAGLTNEQAWARYGIAIAGAVAPRTATTRTGITGLIRPL
ncbi:MAG: G8 domain-containing protein [Gemmataceae bacterium]|nr:G8 domain-containing protein [Gemmataceae bacterium]